VALTALTITHADVNWHEAFLRFVPRVFRRISFRRWYEYGGWDERYVAFALADGDRIVANASLTRMQVVLNGARLSGWQLGSVGTDPERRGAGLQNLLLPRLLEHTRDDELVFLFANHRVLDFYPRFGFRREREQLFHAQHAALPSSSQLRTLLLESAEDRALLRRVGENAQPVTTRFGAQNYAQLVLWYWCNFYPTGLRYAPDCDAIFVVEQAGEVLRIYDVVSAGGPLELRSYVPRLIQTPIARLEFGFTPTRFWPDAAPRADYTDSPLFVRGPQHLPELPFKFPMLAQM